MQYYIYLTTNLINNKKYIGQHKGKATDSYLGSGINLVKAIKKYGKENFTKEILLYCETQEETDIMEKFYIQQYNAVEDENFYNLTEGGQQGDGWRAAQKWLKNNPEKAKEIYQKNYQNLQKWKEENPEKFQEQVIKPMLDGAKKWRLEHPKEVEQNMIKVNQAKIEWEKNNPKQHQAQIDTWRQAGAKANSQKVICLTTNEIFNSQSEAARFYKIPQGNISKCIQGERKSAGKHPITKKKLIWAIYKEN